MKTGFFVPRKAFVPVNLTAGAQYLAVTPKAQNEKIISANKWQ
jgi:hypothetical protein